MVATAFKKAIERAEKRLSVTQAAREKEDNKKSRRLHKRAQRKLTRFKRRLSDCERRAKKEGSGDSE